nr:hypothetical protein [Tanacetum cinerariifolium]
MAVWESLPSEPSPNKISRFTKLTQTTSSQPYLDPYGSNPTTSPYQTISSSSISLSIFPILAFDPNKAISVLLIPDSGSLILSYLCNASKSCLNAHGAKPPTNCRSRAVEDPPASGKLIGKSRTTNGLWEPVPIVASGAPSGSSASNSTSAPSASGSTPASSTLSSSSASSASNSESEDSSLGGGVYVIPWNLGDVLLVVWMKEIQVLLEDVDIEEDDDAEIIFPYEVQGDQTPPPRDESSYSEFEAEEADDELKVEEAGVEPEAEGADVELEAEEPDGAPEATIGTGSQRSFAVRDFPMSFPEAGESSTACDLQFVGGLAPWALRHDLEALRRQERIREAESGMSRTEIALLGSKARIGKIEREILHHDLSSVKETLENVVERLKVLESKENATLKKKLADKEMLLDLTCMDRDRAERRLSESIWWNERFYLEMVRKGAVPKPPSDDEGSERLRKMPKKSDGDKGPSDPCGPLIMVEPKAVKVEQYLRGLTKSIRGDVTSLQPAIINDTKCKNMRHAGDCWKCIKCDKLGHTTERCRIPEMSCYNYNEKGHKKKDCPKLGRNRQGGNNHEVENADLKAQIQEKVFANAALKNELKKSKGNNVDTKFAKPSILGKPVLQPPRNQLVVRQPNAFKSERPNFSKPWFASQVDVNNVLSKPVTPHYLPKVEEYAPAKPHHVNAPSSSMNSKKESYGSNDMAHNYYLEEAKKKTQDKNRNLKPREMPFAKTHHTPNDCTP